MSITRAAAKAKGRSGEWEILSMLGQIIHEEYTKRGWPIPEKGVLQRGPNGKDIVGLSWLAPEVKRHEPANGAAEIFDCQIEKWWDQCKRNAGPNALPVLFWRRNHRPWTVRTYAYLPISNGGRVRTPVDMPIEPFLVWFQNELKARWVTTASLG